VTIPSSGRGLPSTRSAMDDFEITFDGKGTAVRRWRR